MREDAEEPGMPVGSVPTAQASSLSFRPLTYMDFKSSDFRTSPGTTVLVLMGFSYKL